MTTTHFRTVGHNYRNFQVTKAIEIAELQCWLYEFKHLPTGATVMHIANGDPENVFCLSFQTQPYNSNGVAHILEHTVLCGSKKFPVKDPFFAMTRRSLNTFMNAFTGADFTCYPAATQVHKDFYNLLEVYIDAVFHPNLNYYNFLQEGYRLELSDPADINSPLTSGGIVYNEMKGAMASPTTRTHALLYSHLFPNLTYGYNSGGDPKVIPSITYEELCAFHKKHYHPSHCLFFFYGNMDIKEHLDFITTHALQNVELACPLPLIGRQERLKSPQRIVAHYPFPMEESTEHKSIVAMGWLTCHVLEQEELMALGILELILLDTDASPLRKALLKSGLCKQVGSNIESDLSEVPFTITLKGCQENSTPQIEALLFDTLATIAAKGVPLQSVESALHQLEFHRSEINGDQGPFGLSLFMRAALLKQHGAFPEEGLKIHSLIERLHARNLADPQYFSKLIHKHFLDNPHYVAVTMVPDKELAAKEIADEEAALEQIRQTLTASQLQHLALQAEKLEIFQTRQEDADCDILPTLKLSDVPARARDLSLQCEKIDGWHIFHHNTFTNGIIYADIGYDLPYITPEDLPLVRLFSLIITQVGCGGRHYTDHLDYIQENLGSLGGSLTFNLQATDATQMAPSIYIRGKALNRKASKLFTILKDVASSADFSDVERLREVVMKHYTALHSSLQQGALRYALNLSASSLDMPSHIANHWYGLDYYYFIKKIANSFNSELPRLLAGLQKLKKQLLCLENPHLIITSEASMFDDLKRHHFYGLTSLPQNKAIPWRTGYQCTPIEPQAFVIATPVAFIGKVFKTVPYAHPHSPALNVAAFLMDNLILHPKIREQGGAYGGGATCNSMSANFYFYSYRDPNINSTFEAFDEALNTIAEGNFDDSDLEEAKFEMIQALDNPISPGSRGDVAYGWWREGKPHAMRQQFRDAVIALTPQQVIDAVKENLVPTYPKGVEIVFANSELLTKENQLLAHSGKTPLKISGI